MKSILLPIHPDILVNILNDGADTLIRKLFPKDYVGWVYIYCTSGHQENKCLYKTSSVDWEGKPYYDTDCYQALEGNIDQDIILNSKVVARFWCDKVEEIDFVDRWDWEYETETLCEADLLDESCLTKEELHEYLNEKLGYAIHISKLEVFDKPRELKEFSIPIKINKWTKLIDFNDYMLKGVVNKHIKPLAKAPSNYCYIESEDQIK